MQKEGIHGIAGVTFKKEKKRTNVRNRESRSSRNSRYYLRVTRFRSLPSSSTSIGSGETWMTLIF